MKALLDTYASIWWLFDDAKLSQAARAVIADPQNQTFISAVSVWEIAIQTVDQQAATAE